MSVAQINIVHFKAEDSFETKIPTNSSRSSEFNLSGFKLVVSSSDQSVIRDYLDKENVAVVIIEINSAITNHISFIKELLSKKPKLNLLIYTGTSSSMDVLSALRMGVKGYLVKPKTTDELFRSIELVSIGTVVIDESIAPTLRASLQLPEQQHILSELTHRENHIIWLVAQGLKNKDIAEECNITEKTVRNSISKALKKLGFKDRREAIKKLREMQSNLVKY